jgi:hypothetical protein
MQSYSLSGGVDISKEDLIRLREIDNDILSKGKNFEPRDRDLEIRLRAAFPKWGEMELDDQINRIKSKFRTYHNTNYSWGIVVIAQLIAVGAWFVPELILAQRKKLVLNEAEEDTLQLQTIISILMYTRLDTLGVMEWLVQQSRLHKEVLMYAYHEYPSDPEMALEKLRDKSVMPDFQQLIERLNSTVYSVSLLEAFGDIAAEKEQALRLREMKQEVMLDKNRRFASGFVKAPMVLVALFSFIGPLVILGVSEFAALLPELMGTG